MTTENLALGESEHDKAMLKLADEAANPVVDDVVEEDDTPARPDWLPEKFKSAEDMAKAYSALESKLGKGDEAADKEGDDKEGDDKEADDTAPGLDFNNYAQELNDEGKLSQASLDAIKKAGIPDEVRDSYIEAQQSKTSALVQRFADTAGSEDAIQEVLVWAGEKGDKALAKAYSYASEAGDFDTAHSIFETMVNSYKTATGFEGKSVEGVTTQSSGNVFESQAQVSEAMSSPKYSGPKADPAYIREVERKIMRSKNLM